MSGFISVSLKKINIVVLVLVCAVLIARTLQHHAIVTSSSPQSNARLLARSCGIHYSPDFDLLCFYYRSHEGGGFLLPLALLKQKNNTSEDRDLVVYIPGGPGQGNMTGPEQISLWMEWMQAGQLTFDVLLFDPRGTGDGKPAARCPSYLNNVYELIAQSPELSDEYLRLNKALASCFDDYARELAKIFPALDKQQAYELFATRYQAEDIEGMVKALDYKRAHLWGVSYGTRLALAAAHSDVVKSLVLDSIYPFDKGLYSGWIGLYNDSFDQHENAYQRFRKDKSAVYRDLYRKVLDRVKATPLELKLKAWKDDSVLAFVLTENRLLELSFSTLYSPHLYSSYYAGLESFASTGVVTQDLEWSLEYFVNNVVDEEFSSMVYFAVECLDNVSESLTSDDFVFDGFPEYEAYFYAGLKHNICQQYGFSTDVSVSNLSYANKPTLIFSGSFDPVTPSLWGDALSAILPDARHIELPNAGHAGLRGSDCNWSFLNAFIDTGSTNIDIHCKVEALWP